MSKNVSGLSGANWTALESNRLYHVNDAQSDATAYNNDIDDPGNSYNASNLEANTYGYDASGNLIKDKTAGTDKETITWTATGKIKTIKRENASTKPDLEFGYNASGERLFKLIKPRTGSGLTDNDQWTTEYYVRDASGNVMATYTEKFEGQGTYEAIYHLGQHMIYGSKRHGIVQEDVKLTTRTFSASTNNEGEFTNINYQTSATDQYTLYPEVVALLRGKKHYELSNHLGNVLTVIQDRRRAKDDNSNGTTDYYIPYIVQVQDYYAFGSSMEDRSWAASVSSGYRYSFNGKEQDNEVNGSGNTIAFEARIYDSRLGRFFSTDPWEYKYAWQTTYAYFRNSPIVQLDFLGKGGGDEPAKRSTASRHLLSKLNFFAKGSNTLVIDPKLQSSTALDALYKEALTLLREGKIEGDVKLSNGQTWNINKNTGKFFPKSGPGTVTSSRFQMARLAELTKNLKQGATGEAAFANMIRGLEGAGFTGIIDGGFATTIKLVADKFGVSESVMIKSLDKYLPKASPTPEQVTAAESKFGSTKGRWLKWGGRTVLVLALANDVRIIYNSENRAKTTFTKGGGWAGAFLGAELTGSAMTATGIDLTGPWGWAAHAIGTIGGGITGYYAGETVAETYYEWVFEEIK